MNSEGRKRELQHLDDASLRKLNDIESRAAAPNKRFAVELAMKERRREIEGIRRQDMGIDAFSDYATQHMQADLRAMLKIIMPGLGRMR